MRNIVTTWTFSANFAHPLRTLRSKAFNRRDRREKPQSSWRKPTLVKADQRPECQYSALLNSSTIKNSTVPLVVDCLISQLVHLSVQRQISGRVQLRHEDYDHFFFRVDREFGVEKASPAIRADRPQF